LCAVLIHTPPRVFKQNSHTPLIEISPSDNSNDPTILNGLDCVTQDITEDISKVTKAKGDGRKFVVGFENERNTISIVEFSSLGYYSKDLAEVFIGSIL
jgi:hypothetical protein